MNDLARFNALTLLRKPYLIFYFIPQLKKKGCSLSLPFAFSSNTLKVKTQAYFYKISFFSNQLQTENDNYHLIVTNYPELKPFIPAFEMKQFAFYCHFKMKKYQTPLPENTLHLAKKILDVFRHYEKKESITLEAHPAIKRGLYLLGVMYGDNYQQSIATKLEDIMALPWGMGPTHGDFHLGNLLEENGRPILVDLDSFHRGIQALDALNYLLDYLSHQNQQPWAEILIKVVNENGSFPETDFFQHFFDHDLKSVALLYILYKLAYENSHYHFLSKSLCRAYNFIQKLYPQ